MPLLTRQQFKVKENEIENILIQNEIERKEKLKKELLKKKITIFVVGGSDNEGLNAPTMRLFKNILKAKEYEDKIRPRNDYTEMSLVTKSGEFIYVLKEEILEMLKK